MFVPYGIEYKKPLLQAHRGALPKEGVEPSPCCQDGILNPARLPVPPLRPNFIDDVLFTSPRLLSNEN